MSMARNTESKMAQTIRLTKTHTSFTTHCRFTVPAKGQCHFTDTLGGVSRVARKSIDSHIAALVADGWTVDSKPADPWAEAEARLNGTMGW